MSKSDAKFIQTQISYSGVESMAGSRNYQATLDLRTSEVPQMVPFNTLAAIGKGRHIRSQVFVRKLGFIFATSKEG